MLVDGDTAYMKAQARIHSEFKLLHAKLDLELTRRLLRWGMAAIFLQIDRLLCRGIVRCRVEGEQFAFMGILNVYILFIIDG